MASDRIPKPSHHKASGQAVLRLNGKDYYLGRYGSRAAKDAGDELIARWLAHGRQLPGPDTGLAVNDLILAYNVHAKTYYETDGKKSKELECIQHALRIVKAIYGKTMAEEFGPKKLKAVREKMVEADWCRNYVNHQCDRVRRVFRWAASEELLPGSVYHSLQAVPGIRRGMPGVRESAPVKPVPEAFILATRPFLPPPVRAMVDLQLLTGCRPGEACSIRAIDIDMSGRVWIYRPTTHKTAHQGHERAIYLGPRAQQIIRPWLTLNATAYLFSPAQAEAARNAERRMHRKSPITPSQAKRKPKRKPRRPKRDHYDVACYRRAIARACGRADRKAREDDPATPEGEALVPAWHPHQLRHNAGTNLRKQFGVEMARIILGHATAFTTEIYAEADQKQAIEVMGRIG